MMRALLIGSRGQLGSELQHAFKDEDMVPLPHADLELTNLPQIWYTD